MQLSEGLGRYFAHHCVQVMRPVGQAAASAVGANMYEPSSAIMMLA